jgi:hypothetical protein
VREESIPKPKPTVTIRRVGGRSTLGCSQRTDEANKDEVAMPYRHTDFRIQAGEKKGKAKRTKRGGSNPTLGLRECRVVLGTAGKGTRSNHWKAYVQKMTSANNRAIGVDALQD